MSEHSFDVFLLDLEMETAKVSFSFYMCVCVFIATACVSAHSKILEAEPSGKTNRFKQPAGNAFTMAIFLVHSCSSGSHHICHAF